MSTTAPDPQPSPLDAAGRALIPGVYAFWDYDDLVLFGGALLPSLIAGRLLAAVAGSLFKLERGIESFILQFTAYACWFAALYAIFHLRHGRPFWASLGWNLRLRQAALCFLSGIAVAVGLVFVSAFLDKPSIESTPMQELLNSDVTLILVGLFSTTLGPLCEELAFRGFLLPLFARTAGVAGGILLSTIPFAIAHAPQYAYSWRHVALVGLAGVAFGWARYKTGSTAAAAAMHSAYNLTIFSGLLYERYSW